MGQFTLEVCCDSVESALAAERGGADRIELCSNLVIGGTTPDLALYETIREKSKIRIHALLRPRFGDFLYTDAEFEILKKNVRMYREAGVEGIVIGCLTADGDLDIKKMELLRKEAGEMWITLHRAFDVCRDPLHTMRLCRELGIDCILTSGQRDTAYEGAELLKELVEQAGEKGPEVLIGSGVTSGNLEKLFRMTGALQYHMSGKISLDSGMRYRKEGVHMGLREMSEYTVFRTDEHEIRSAVEVLRKLEQQKV